jgi:hypothetical protein
MTLAAALHATSASLFTGLQLKLKVGNLVNAVVSVVWLVDSQHLIRPVSESLAASLQVLAVKKGGKLTLQSGPMKLTAAVDEVRRLD